MCATRAARLEELILGRRREEHEVPPIMTAPRVPPVHRRGPLEIVPILVAMHMDAEVRYRQREGTQNLVAATDVVGVARSSASSRVRREGAMIITATSYTHTSALQNESV